MTSDSRKRAAEAERDQSPRVPVDVAEGRRLLAEYDGSPVAVDGIYEWLFENAAALLDAAEERDTLRIKVDADWRARLMSDDVATPEGRALYAQAKSDWTEHMLKANDRLAFDLDAALAREKALREGIEALADEWERAGLAQDGPSCEESMACSICIKAEQADTLRALLSPEDQSAQGNPDSHEWLGMDR